MQTLGHAIFGRVPTSPLYGAGEISLPPAYFAVLPSPLALHEFSPPLVSGILSRLYLRASGGVTMVMIMMMATRRAYDEWVMMDPLTWGGYVYIYDDYAYNSSESTPSAVAQQLLPHSEQQLQASYCSTT